MLSVHHRSDRPLTPHEKTQRIIYIIRQVMNVLFIILAIVGGVMYSGLVGGGNTVLRGGFIVIVAVVIKMGESILRLVNK
ncbi:MAG: hypothetical protein IKN75_06550 [Prevotella sp.]|nr:hypothetical protein [Prevotella sp.]